jgi:hypothetical protein
MLLWLVQEKHPSVVEHGFSEERIRREFASAGLINVDVKPRVFLMSKSMPAAYGWKSITCSIWAKKAAHPTTGFHACATQRGSQTCSTSTSINTDTDTGTGISLTTQCSWLSATLLRNGGLPPPQTCVYLRFAAPGSRDSCKYWSTVPKQKLLMSMIMPSTYRVAYFGC